MKDINQYILLNFSIDENTGVITRMDRANSNGSYDKDGYLIIKIKTKQFKSHRLAWFLYYNEWPNGEIDHINRVRTDNRKCNLRVTDRLGNVMNINRAANKDTNVVGVYIDKTKGLKKVFALRHKRKTFRFYTLDEAINFKKLNK
jgi:hypothetical protein